MPATLKDTRTDAVADLDEFDVMAAFEVIATRRQSRADNLPTSDSDIPEIVAGRCPPSDVHDILGPITG